MEVPRFETKSIECCDCGITFDFDAGEQAYFWSKGLADPKRCPACRKYRRQVVARSNALIESRVVEHGS